MDGTALQSSMNLHVANEGSNCVSSDATSFSGPFLNSVCDWMVPPLSNCDAERPQPNENEEEDMDVTQSNSIIISPSVAEAARVSSRELLHSLLRSRPLQQTTIPSWEPRTVPLAITWHNNPDPPPPPSHKRMRSTDWSEEATHALLCNGEEHALKRFRSDTCNGSWSPMEWKAKCESYARAPLHMANRKRPREEETYDFFSERRANAWK